MKRRLGLALIVPGFAAIFAIAIGAGYLMGQTSFRPSLPPPGQTMPTIPSPGASAPSGPDSQPSSAPVTSPPSPADQPTGGESPQGPPLGPAAPTPAPSGNVTQTQQIPAPSPPPNEAPPLSGPTAVPPIPEPPSRFHVQAGLFENRDGAATLVQQLRDRGYAVTLVEGPPYRVWVGGYLDRTTAERLAANLQAAGFDASLTPR